MVSSSTVTAAQLMVGATVSDLARIFKGGHADDVQARLAKAGARPSGTRNGANTYRIKDVAPLMFDPFQDVELVDRILSMHHNSLPKLLAREYWNGKIARAKYLEANGDLWPTTKVVEKLGEAYKTLRLSLQLMSDAVEREDGLSIKQREIMQRLIDSTLNDMRERLLENGVTDGLESEVSGPASPEDDDESQEL